MEAFASVLRIGGFFIFIVFCFAFAAYGQAKRAKPKYLDAKMPIELRVSDLLSRMTLEEKVGQLQCEIKNVFGKDSIIERGIGGLAVPLRQFKAREAAEKANWIQKTAIDKTRLGIPIIIHDEALHGLVGNGPTSFPQAIGLAAMWNPDLLLEIATVVGKEAKSRGIRQVLSPVVNIARDVRWGRVEETYGEDPYLTARMGVAFCKGFEQQGVITTPKHFAANVGDGGRDSNPIHFSELQLREIYFPAFKACFHEAGALSVMAAYNSLGGLPCSANKWLLTDVLRKEWGFKGFVVSDYGSAAGIMNMHHVAENEKEAAVKGLESGLDIELPGVYIYGKPLLTAVKEKLVSKLTLDRAVRRVLAAKFELGLFENPYVDPEYAAKLDNCDEHRALALASAREAIVLLKNNNNLLPLDKNLKNVAVIGSHADGIQLGGYSGFGMKVVTPLEGIKRKVGQGTMIRYAKGCELSGAPLPPIPPENLVPPAAKPGEHGLKGEYFNNMELSGKPSLVRIDEKVYFDWGAGSPDSTINVDHFSARWTGKLVPSDSGVYKLSVSSDDGVRLYIDGSLLIDSWYDRGVTSDFATVKLQGGRQYDLRMEYYENGGWAFASLGWDMKPELNRDIQNAVELAKTSDVAIVVASINEGEGRDRSNLDLPGAQEELIKAITETGTPTVVVLMTGSAVTMSKWVDKVPAVVEAWYAGEEGGGAIADVLFGDYNPAGRLPITFPQAVGQVPLYYNHKPTGRAYDYTDLSGKPLFPFGHGLSYTKFEYSNLKIDPSKITPKGKVEISFEIKNVGNRKGDEVVQLYLHDIVASVTRPVKELKGFRRIALDSKEKKTVSFEVTPDQLSFLDQNMKSVVEPGTFEVMIGSSSEDIRLKSTFEVVKR